MANTLPYYTLPANINTNSLIKYFIDPVDDANSGFYLYLWDVEAGVFTRSEQYSDEIAIDDRVLILDGDLPDDIIIDDGLGQISARFMSTEGSMTRESMLAMIS